jgi:membrane-associated phospholipid phosphatase
VRGSRARRRSSPTPRAAVRAAAGAAIVASIALPLARRRLRLPAAAAAAATVAGPLGLVVLAPRTKLRDAVLYVMQMWAFTVLHELPYDHPERLRARLRIRYPIRADLVIGGGELPNLRLQRTLAIPGRVRRLDRVLAFVHWAWFAEPHAALLWILLRRERHFPRAARQLAAAFDLGCAVYFLVPTAPPWWAAENGYIDQELAWRAGASPAGAESEAQTESPSRRRGQVVVAGDEQPAGSDSVRRVMVEVGEQVWGDAWPGLYSALGGNPWAAMPSLHFATSLLAAILLAESAPGAGAVGGAYAAALALALVYLGEHYAIDLIAGAALVATVRLGEPLADPAARALSTALQRLERIAGA